MSGNKQTIIIPSKHNYVPQDPEDIEGVEETEITAQISLPAEGGWGWVVVAASFGTNLILDGIFFTFGSIFHDMAKDLAVGDSLVALTNSVATAMYFLAAPFASALINRFGFRLISMSGSIISSIAFLSTYFSTSYLGILLLYGFGGGFGGCLTGLVAGIIVGFYFERLRALAMSIATVGCSVGVMMMFPINSQIVKIAGWRVLMLMHAGLLGTIYFFSMTYRPLVSLTITTTAPADKDPTRTVTYLPSLAAIKASPSRTKPDRKRESLMPSGAERLFSAVSNVHFPTAAAVIGERAVPTSSPTKAGPSTAAASRLTVTAQGPQGGVSRRQLKQVQSIISKSRVNIRDKDKNIEKQKEIKLIAEENLPKKKWWRKLFKWEEEVSEARPMYRDDAFYAGKIDQLPAYQKSMMETPPEERTGIEYQMAVSRAVTTEELKEKRGVCTTAARRILATMMDPRLLSRLSFLLLCTSGSFTYLGYYVPYVFLPDKAKRAGVPPEHCTLFVSVMGGASAFGRLSMGALAMKFNPVNLYTYVCLMSGVSLVAFTISSNVIYTYVISAIYGFHVASLSSIRNLVLVHLYGLEMLTSATGMMLLFQGFGCLLSTPLSSILKGQFGYTVAFYVASIFLLISGLVLLPVRKLNEKEKSNEQPTPTATPNKV